MTAFAAGDNWDVHCADCLDVLRGMDDCSVDMVATDPPYGIRFMNREWDRALPDPAIWHECLRVLKPGGAACVMSGARLDCLWRICRDLEEAGFELQQSCFTYIFRSGFPKGGDLSKMADKRAGAEREVVGKSHYAGGRENGPYTSEATWSTSKTPGDIGRNITAPATHLAVALDGQFTKGKLKPAMEFIIWARKPISEATELDNVVRWGTGSVNCGKCMVPYCQRDYDATVRKMDSFKRTAVQGGPGVALCGSVSGELNHIGSVDIAGRFPANVLCMDNALGEGSRYFDIDAWAAEHGIAEDGWADAAAAGMIQVPKPSRAEKNQGCEGLPESKTFRVNAGGREAKGADGKWDDVTQRWITQPMNNGHPSVKPVRLFSYIINLLCPSGGLVLDPFCGSGTTGVAAVQAGYQFIGCDMEQEYCEIARARIEHATPKREDAAGETVQLQIAGM